MFVLDEGCTVPSPFELTHYCLLPVPTQNWLNFFPDNSSFSVYTNNRELIGNKTVLVVQIFKHFPEVLPYVKFNIELTTIEFRSKIKKLYYNYFIDLVNEPIELKSHYLVQTGYQITSIEASLLTDNLPSSSFKVDDHSLELILNVTSHSFDGIISEINICAYLINSHSDCNLTVIVTFRALS